MNYKFKLEPYIYRSSKSAVDSFLNSFIYRIVLWEYIKTKENGQKSNQRQSPTFQPFPYLAFHIS